jgi:hypothetical protein
MKSTTVFGVVLISSYVSAQDVRTKTTSLGISQRVGATDWAPLDGLMAYYRGKINATQWYFTMLKDGMTSDCDETILGFNWNDNQWHSCYTPQSKPLRYDRTRRPNTSFRIRRNEAVEGFYNKVAVEVNVLELEKESM